MRTVFENIKRIRKQKGLTQTEVAEVAGISRNSYILIEKGITKDILLQTAIGISKALNEPFNELFEVPGNTDSKRLKDLFLRSLDQAVSFQIIFYEHNEMIEDPLLDEEYIRYSTELKKFKNGVLMSMVNNGLFTQEDIIKVQERFQIIK